MKMLSKLFFVLTLVSVFAVSCKKDEEEDPPPATQYEVINISTGYGDFMIWLYTNTPQHRQNFLNLANQGFYDSLTFHRVVENFVIQGGDPQGTGYGGPGYNIPAEIVSGLNHVYGAVGAARLPDNINPDRESNGSQFYIVSDPNGEPYLNGNYTVFGLVFHGMTAVDAISHVAVDTLDKPLNNVYMKSVKVEKYTATQLKDNFGFTIPQ